MCHIINSWEGGKGLKIEQVLLFSLQWQWTQIPDSHASKGQPALVQNTGVAILSDTS